MSLTPPLFKRYHVFLASPGDVNLERQHVRRFFEDYNRSTAHLWDAEFQVVDWENYATIGVGRPQELITRHTLAKYKDSLALVVGIMGQRFGSPTGQAESGTEEEFNWAMESHKTNDGFPEIKWFFLKTGKVELPDNPAEADKAFEQWKQVQAFRTRMQDLDNPVFYTEYPSSSAFGDIFDHDLALWLNDSSRPWAAGHVGQITVGDGAASAATPAEFDSKRYSAAIRQRFESLNFEMLDTTGAFYSGVRLWSVFVPQAARECHQYNPRLLEIPKEHQQRLKTGGITAQELADAEEASEQLRREYFSQPLRPVVDVIDEAFRSISPHPGHRLVILGDPGSGKSSLVRYVALQWAGFADRAAHATQPMPLVIELGSYERWRCTGRKGFVRFLEEGPTWHDWKPGLLERLLQQDNRVALLLDGLDEIFDPTAREEVINDMERFSTACPQTPIVVTSRVVGYQPQRLRDAEFRHFMLQDLDPTQIDTFIDRWHEQTFGDVKEAASKRERLKKSIGGSKSIAMLAGNPLLLTMMAILNRNQDLPRDRIDLYGRASRLLLEQWDTERALTEFPGLSAEIAWREKSDILRRVASQMQAGVSGLKGNMIDGSTLTRLVEDYLLTELHFTQSRAAARAVVEHLRQRNFILCVVGADGYGFVHRTLLEYFCAADIVHQFNVAKTLDEDGLVALFETHAADDEWREVLRLICSLIDERFVGRMIDRVVKRTDLSKWNDKDYLPELVLAVLLVQEVRHAQRLELVGGALLDLVLDVIRKAHVVVGLGDRLMIDDIAGAIETVGTRWPGAARFLPLPVPTFKYRDGAGQLHWARLVAAIEGDVAEKRIGGLASESDTDLVRIGAIGVLAEKWPHRASRAVIATRAVQDTVPFVRRMALQLLVNKWPDETTRTLLASRTVDDPDGYVRYTALEWLAKKWPDETTRVLLTGRATQHGSAASLLGGWHSTFGRIVFMEDLDESGRYLDPREPISRDHINAAARKANVAVDRIDETVRSLSAHMSWDVERGFTAANEAR